MSADQLYHYTLFTKMILFIPEPSNCNRNIDIKFSAHDTFLE